jgi:hypothetical protein
MEFIYMCHKLKINRSLTIIIAALAFLSFSASADERVPKHLQFAREHVATLSPEYNIYSNYPRWVRWKGDLFTPHSEAHTDCTGFVGSVLERASCSISKQQFISTSRNTLSTINDYFDFISQQKDFKRIDVITDIRPGDIIVVKYNIGNSGRRKNYSGHVMLVDLVPIPRSQDTTPIVKGTTQWEVTILDSTNGYHGATDTRYRADGTKQTGVGRGVLRLYTNGEGRVIGYSNSIHKKSVYYDDSTQPLVIGRVLCYTTKE